MVHMVAVDARGLQKLSRDLKKIGEKDLNKQLRAGLKKSGEIVAESARQKSSWSTRIPASVKVVVTQKGVAVRAGGESAPHAGTFEGKNNGTPMRHPVFARGDSANWTWVAQTPRPFLKPALESNIEKVADAMVGELEVAFFNNGFVRGSSPKGRR